MACIYANLLEQKNCLHKKRVQLPKDWFGTPTWPPFHWFGTSIWPLWRRVKTLYRVFRSEDCDLDNETLSANRSVTMFDVWEGLVPVMCRCCSSYYTILVPARKAFLAGTKSSPVRIFASWIFLIFRRLVLLWKRIAWPENNARLHLFLFTRQGKSTIFTAESGHLRDKQKVPITSWSGQRLSCGYGDILPCL